MENTPEKKVEPTQEVPSPGRRRLLKALAAGGVVTAASMVPGKWSSPVLKSGVLPAHAQVTPNYMIRCSGDDPILDEIITLNFGATVSPIPPVGTALVAVLDTTPSQNQTRNTDVNGEVAFNMNVNFGDFQGPITATISFQNPQLGSPCQVLFTIPNGAAN